MTINSVSHTRGIAGIKLQRYLTAQIEALSLTGSASRTDLSQLANGIWEIHAGCPSFLRVSSVAKIGYIPQFKASNARDQDEVSSDLARMQIEAV